MLELKGHRLNIERHFYMDELEETYFEVRKPDGNYCHIDWSGWGAAPTEEDFALWIDLGYPNRDHPALADKKGIRPINSEDLKIIKAYEGQ